MSTKTRRASQGDSTNVPTPPPTQRDLPPIPEHPQKFDDPVPGLIRDRSITAVDGGSGTLKTTTLVQLVRCLNDETEFFGFPTTKRHTRWLLLDRPYYPTYSDIFNGFHLVPGKDFDYYALLDDPEYDPRKEITQANDAFKLTVKYFHKLKPEPGDIVFIDVAFPDLVYGGDICDPINARHTVNFWRMLVTRFQITLIVVSGGNKLKKGQGYANSRFALPGSQVFSLKVDTMMTTQVNEGPAPGTVRLDITPRGHQLVTKLLTFDPHAYWINADDESTNPPAAEDPAMRAFNVLPSTGLSFTAWFAAYHVATGLGESQFKRDRRVLVSRNMVEARGDLWVPRISVH